MLYNRTLKEYQSLRRPMNQFGTVRQFNFGFENFQSPWFWQQHQNQCHQPHTDILELDDQYVLEVALPGVVLDDVEIKAEGNCLAIVAKRTLAMFEEKAAILRKELPSGYMVREFMFEHEILPEQIEARMDKGILFISVPKLEAAVRIPVSAGTIEGHLPSLKTRVPKSAETTRTSVKEPVTSR